MPHSTLEKETLAKLKASLDVHQVLELDGTPGPARRWTFVRPFPASAGYMEIFSVLYRDLDSYEAVSEEIAVLDPFVRGGDIPATDIETFARVMKELPHSVYLPVPTRFRVLGFSEGDVGPSGEVQGQVLSLIVPVESRDLGAQKYDPIWERTLKKLETKVTYNLKN